MPPSIAQGGYGRYPDHVGEGRRRVHHRRRGFVQRPPSQTRPDMTVVLQSPDSLSLTLLRDRVHATAAAIGAVCRMTPGEVQSPLVHLESPRLVSRPQDGCSVFLAGSMRSCARNCRRSKRHDTDRMVDPRGNRLAGIPQTHPAPAAGLELVTRAELAGDMSMLMKPDPAIVQHPFEATRMEFLHEDGGIGVRLREVEP